MCYSSVQCYVLTFSAIFRVLCSFRMRFMKSFFFYILLQKLCYSAVLPSILRLFHIDLTSVKIGSVEIQRFPNRAVRNVYKSHTYLETRNLSYLEICSFPFLASSVLDVPLFVMSGLEANRCHLSQRAREAGPLMYHKTAVQGILSIIESDEKPATTVLVSSISLFGLQIELHTQIRYTSSRSFSKQMAASRFSSLASLPYRY